MNPNTNNSESQPLTMKEKLAVSAGAATLAIAAGAGAIAGVNALANPDHGESNQPGNVTVQFHENGTAWDAARDIMDTDASQRDLASKIQEQTDAQGDPGVQAGETAILPAADINHQALQEYVVPTGPTSEITPPDEISDGPEMFDHNPVEVVPQDTPVEEKPDGTTEPQTQPNAEPKSNEAPQEVVPEDTPVMESPDQPEEVVPNDTPVVPAPEETTQPEQPQEVVPQDTPVIPQP